jgi:hypothetical protein
MNQLQQKVVEIFERPWDDIAGEAKRLMLQHERLLNSPSRKERAKIIGFNFFIQRGAVKFYYSDNANTWGGPANGGGRGWYVRAPRTVGCQHSERVLAD